MKRIITIALLSVLAVLAAVSCRKEPEQTIDWRTELQVVKSNLVFMPGGGTETLEVNLSNVSVTADKSWCSASVSGNTVSVTASANSGKQSRYAKLTITSGSESVTAAVIQYGEVFDGLELADMEVPNKGGQFAYPYTTNLTVDVKADQPWVHISFDEENPIVYVTVDKHEGFGTRVATVTYTAGSNSGSARVIQEPTYGAVSGWKAEDTDGRYVFPDQIDEVTVTPPAEMASAPYFWALGDPSELLGKDIPTYIRESAAEVKAAVEAGLVTLSKGTDAKEYTNLPSTATAVIILFDDQNYPTGQYVVMDVAIPDRGPKKTLVEGWDIAHAGGTYAHPDQTDQFTLTPKAGFEDVKYIATAVNKASVASIEDYAFSTFAMETREAILAKVASGELPDFDAGLSKGETTIEAENVSPDAYVVVIAFSDNQFYTGEYQVAEIAVPDLAYYAWLGEWTVPRANAVDTWIVTENVPGESYKVSGIAGFNADDRAPGAFVAIVPYDPATREMVFKVYENTAVTWQDSSRGTMNGLLSGQYTNVEGKTYYNSGVGNTIARAKMADGGQTAELTPRAVTSAGAPAYFYNIRWYGRYTTSTGSRSGVSYSGLETALPNVMTKK